MFKWLFGEKIKELVSSDPSYQAALEFANKRNPKEPAPDSVDTFAIAEFERSYKAVEDLDKKAENLARLLGAGSGIISFVVWFGGRVGLLESISTWTALYLLTLLLLLVPGIILSVASRSPVKMPFGPAPWEMLRYSDYANKHAHQKLVAQIATAVSGLDTVKREKAILIRRSGNLALCAIAWLALGAVVQLLRIVAS